MPRMAQTGAGETIEMASVYAELSGAEWPFMIPAIRDSRQPSAAIPSKGIALPRGRVRRIGLILRGKLDALR
jgi:hypothetical protein